MILPSTPYFFFFLIPFFKYTRRPMHLNYCFKSARNMLTQEYTNKRCCSSCVFSHSCLFCQVLWFPSIWWLLKTIDSGLTRPHKLQLHINPDNLILRILFILEMRPKYVTTVMNSIALSSYNSNCNKTHSQYNNFWNR